MTRGRKWLFLPALVPVMDAIWGWVLSTYVRPWFFQLLNRSPFEASQYFDSTIEPRQWIGYAVVLVAQLTWVNLIAPRDLSHSLLRQLWWLGVLIITFTSLLLRQGLELNNGAALLLLGVHLGDLILLYWLATRLLTPAPKRTVIPGWW